MIIRDKQALRRCVKQAVRRAGVVETELRFDVKSGLIGVDACPPWGRHTPFGEDAAALCAALDAAGLPAYDLRRAQQQIDGYEREAYLRELTDAMNAWRVLVRVPLERAGEAFFGDDLYAPLLAVGAGAFEAGRYGISYERAAQRIGEAMRACGAAEMLAEDVSEDAMRYALLPLCEDEGFRLHTAVSGAEQARRFGELLAAFPAVRALAWAEGEEPAERDAAERELIALSAREPRVTVRLSSLNNLSLALQTLGARFLAYASRAERMELAAGRWLLFKERLHPLLADAYLPLARSGYELTDEAVARDVQSLMGGCLTE